MGKVEIASYARRLVQSHFFTTPQGAGRQIYIERAVGWLVGVVSVLLAAVFADSGAGFGFGFFLSFRSAFIM